MNDNTKMAIHNIESKGVIEIGDWFQILNEYPHATAMAAEKLNIGREKVIRYIKENKVPSTLLLSELKKLRNVFDFQ